MPTQSQILSLPLVSLLIAYYLVQFYSDFLLYFKIHDLCIQYFQRIY